MSRSVRSLRDPHGRTTPKRRAGSARRSRPKSAPPRRPKQRLTEEDKLTPEDRLEQLSKKCMQCQDNGMMAELITLRIECLALSRLCYGKSDPEVTLAQSRLAEAYLESGLEKQAVEHGTQSLQRARDIPLDDVIQSSAHTLGKAFTKLKEYDKAKELLKEALYHNQKANGRNAVENCPVLCSIAQLHTATGETRQVINTMKKVSALKEPVYGEDHLQMIDTYLELARAFFNHEDDTQCQDNLHKALKTIDSNSSELVLASDPRLLVNKQRKAEHKRQERAFKRQHEDEDEGDEFGGYEDSEEEEEDLEDEVDPDKVDLKLSWKVADANCLLAACTKRAGEEIHKALEPYQKAEELYSALAELQPNTRGSRGAEAAKANVVKIERELATIHTILEDYTRAADHMRNVLAVREKTAPGGRYDVQVARTEQRIGELYTLAKEPKMAKVHFDNAIMLYTALYGERHKTVTVIKDRIRSLNLDNDDGYARHEDGTDDDLDDFDDGYASRRDTARDRARSDSEDDRRGGSDDDRDRGRDSDRGTGGGGGEEDFGDDDI